MKKWYNIVDNGVMAEISIFEEIGGWGVTAADFKNEFDLIRDRASIHVYLNSIGGEVTEGMAIYNMLASARDKVSIEVLGIAGSIASIIALAGYELVMDTGTYLVIHNPFTGAWGDAEYLRQQADILDKIKQQIVNIYVSRSNIPEEKITEMMDAETWITADEAVDFGFAVSVKETAKAAACLWNLEARGYKNVPKNIVARRLAIKDLTIREYENVLRDAGFSQADATRLASAGFPKPRDSASPELEIFRALLECV